MGSDSVTTVYFIEVPGSDEQANARWLAEILRGNYTDIQPWFPEGPAALQRDEVRRRMDALGQSLWQRIDRARRAPAAPGNLRRRNPHFLGRREELRLLHEQLSLGAVGVVTAVHGLGGQGKTELAVAYAHGFADCYPAGLWLIGVEHEKALLPAIGRLAFVSRFADDAEFPFKPTEAQKNNPAELGHAVLMHLKKRADAVRQRDPDKGAAALLLLDNVSEPSLLSPAQLATLPREDWLRIVATTRLDVPPMKDNLALLEVDSLDEETALALIRDHQPLRDAAGVIVTDPARSVPKGVPVFASADQEAAAREIVRALGGFTLAIEQAAVFLGLHPEVTPAAFLASLTAQGLPAADRIGAQPDAAAQMFTQSKQLGLILEATIARLDAPARTALQFAALLPPDTVPWPWLRALTEAAHPGLLAPHSALDPDPWLEIRRRLTGLRLLTPGDDPQIARIHRLVAAHCSPGVPPGCVAGVPPAAATGSGTLPPHTAGTAVLQLEAHLTARARAICENQTAPADWELDALLASMPAAINRGDGNARLVDAFFPLCDRIESYRSVAVIAAVYDGVAPHFRSAVARRPDDGDALNDLCRCVSHQGGAEVALGHLAKAEPLFRECVAIDRRLVQINPANTKWERGLSVSLNNLGDLAVAQGDLAGALRSFTESKTIAERLAASDPANAAWQRDLIISFERLGDIAREQGDVAGSIAHFEKSREGWAKLIQQDPANISLQRGITVPLNKLGDLAVAQGDLAGALRSFTQSQTIRERLAASDPANAAWQRDLSYSCWVIAAKVFQPQQRWAEALALMEQSQRIDERLAATDPTNVTWQKDVEVSRALVAKLRAKVGK